MKVTNLRPYGELGEKLVLTSSVTGEVFYIKTTTFGWQFNIDDQGYRTNREGDGLFLCRDNGPDMQVQGHLQYNLASKTNTTREKNRIRSKIYRLGGK